MSLREFGKKIVKESHTSVNKWEKFHDKPTNMDDNIETVLRLFLIRNFCTKTKAEKNNFFNTFDKITNIDYQKKKLKKPFVI